MKLALGMTIVALVGIATTTQAMPGSGFGAMNPYAMAFNPYFSGVFGGAAGAPVAAPAGGAAAPVAPFGGLSISVLFQQIVLQKEAERLLSQPDFPADLAQRVQDVLSAADTALANCDGATLPWLQIRCAKPILTGSKNELKAIDDEWLARQAATTASSAVVV